MSKERKPVAPETLPIAGEPDAATPQPAAAEHTQHPDAKIRLQITLTEKAAEMLDTLSRRAGKSRGDFVEDLMRETCKGYRAAVVPDSFSRSFAAGRRQRRRSGPAGSSGMTSTAA